MTIYRYECHELTKISRLKSFWQCIGQFGRHICVYAVMVTVVMTKQSVRADWLFVMIGMFSSIGRSVLRMMNVSYRNIIQCRVSIMRSQVPQPLTMHGRTSLNTTPYLTDTLPYMSG